MKKSLLFSAALLGMVMFSDVTTAEEVIHSGDNEKATTSAIVQTNQNISTKLELKQSENLNTYRSTILDNPYGPSTNQSTGIYKRANDVIEIYVDESTDQTQLPTYTVTTSALTNFSEGSANGTQLVKGRNVISGSQVGLIHIRNESGQTAQGKLSIEIKGGVTIPRFILGETTQQEWTKMIADNPTAVGYELVSDRVLVTGSNRTLQDAKDPETILYAHEKVITFHNQTSGLDGSSAVHRKPVGLFQHLRETIQSGYYMYAFYQHTAYSSTSDAMRVVLNPTTMGQWGIWHELGHTYQLSRMNWKDLTEVTVNIYSMRAEKGLGERSRLERDNRYPTIFNYLNGTGQKQFDSQNVWTKLGMFWQLELAFGEDFYPNLHKMYRNEQRSLPTEQDKRQYFVVAASKISGQNLQPFFEKWGIQVTAESRIEMEKLPSLTKKIWEYRDEMTGEVGDIDGGTNNNDKEAPTIPTGLAANEVTSHSVKLAWNSSSDNTKVKGYNIYRNNVKVGTTDKPEYLDGNLKSNEVYVYQVSAYDGAGNESGKSPAVIIKTNEQNVIQDIWRSDQIYTAGDLVIYNGIQYRAKWWVRGERPDTSQAWEKVDKTQTQDWVANKAYSGGDQVVYKGKTYEAKWWNTNSNPETSSVWVLK